MAVEQRVTCAAIMNYAKVNRNDQVRFKIDRPIYFDRKNRQPAILDTQRIK